MLDESVSHFRGVRSILLLLYYFREAPWLSGLSGSVMVQKVAVKCEFEAGLPHAETGKLSLSTQQ